MATSSIAVDNDILLKLACYRLLDRIAGTVSRDPIEAFVLGAARFVLRSAIRRSSRLLDKDSAAECLDRYLESAQIVEPTDVELELATSLEEAALSAGLPLDVGESQLCAIIVKRGIDLFLTGDKRAIAALGQLRDNGRAELRVLEGRILCLEQLMLAIMKKIGQDAIRKHVCAEQGADMTLTICCKCVVPESQADTGDALKSYINSIKDGAPGLLVADETGD